MRTVMLNRMLRTLPIAVVLIACSDDDNGQVSRFPEGYGDYRDQNVTAVGGTPIEVQDPDSDTPVGGSVLVGTPEGSGGQVCFSDTLCEVPQTEGSAFCGDNDEGPVDLIYVDGEVVETICYPPSDDPDRPLELIDSTREGDVEIVQNANNTTVVFSDDIDGQAFVGDITVDGNNVAIYGNGADNTIIDGNVALDGNNGRLRGVTITGDLILSKNNVAIVLSRILGNVVLDGQSTNGSVFAENDIFGSFTSNSNGNVLVGNDVLGAWTLTGNGYVCDRNYAFTDGNGDELMTDDERGALLECP